MERIRRVVGEPTGPERTRWAAPALVVALFATGALLGPPAQATTDADAFVVPSPPEVDEVSEMAPPPPPAPVVDAVPPPPPPVAAAPPTPPPPPASLRAFAVPAPPTPPVVVVPTVPFHTEPLFFSDDGVAAADPAPEAEERPLSIEDVGARALQALADQLDSGAKNLEERAERRWRKKQQRGAADVHVQRHDHQVVIRLGDDTIHHAQGDEGCTTYTAPGARVTVCGDGDVLAIRDDLDDEIGNGFEWSFDLGEFFGNGWSNHVQSLDRNTQVEVRRALEEAQREMDAAQREIEQAMEQARAAREEALQRAHHDRERALEEAERARELRRRLRAQRG